MRFQEGQKVFLNFEKKLFYFSKDSPLKKKKNHLIFLKFRKTFFELLKKIKNKIFNFSKKKEKITY